MEKWDDANYWYMWKHLDEWQKRDIYRRWVRYGRGRKEWLSDAIIGHYKRVYDDFLMEAYYEQERRSPSNLRLLRAED